MNVVSVRVAARVQVLLMIITVSALAVIALGGVIYFAKGKCMIYKATARL